MLEQTKNNKWRNIFYFISYCDDKMKRLRKENINFEDVNNFYDLLATILNVCFHKVIRIGYLKQYEQHEIITDKPRGRIDFAKSINRGTLMKGEVVCHTSELSIDNTPNQIIRIAYNLIWQKKTELRQKNKNEAVNNIQRLSKVSDIDIHKAKEKLRELNVPEYYKPVLSIAEFIMKWWLLKDESGQYKLYTLKDEDMLPYIWEEFLRNYIREQLPKSFTVKKEHYTEFGDDEVDIVIRSNRYDIPTVIFDAKWYKKPDFGSVKHSLIAYGKCEESKYDEMYRKFKQKLKVSAIFKNDSETYSIEQISPSNSYFELWMHCINVNNTFEQIEYDIKRMLEEQLEIKL